MFHGQGVGCRRHMWRYQGQWVDGKRTGAGTCYYLDGGVYEGGWRDDLRCGYGVLTKRDGSRYEGQWADDAAHGQGTCRQVLLK